MGKQCQICGENAYLYYPLCKKHLEMKSDGLLLKCEDCGKWYVKGEKCSCQKEKLHTNDKTSKNEQSGISELSKKTFTISDQESKCITCGKQTNGFLFCVTCYKKYKNKQLLVKINKCSEIELLDDSYEGVYVCDDGHVVKSKSEREIDNYLFKNKIQHAYEKALLVDNNENLTIHPDFCLPNFKGNGIDVYIEHWGYNENNIKYTETKKYKISKYRELGTTLICTYEKDMKDPTLSLQKKLSIYKEKEINFEQTDT